jgi:hypothetical protein
LIVKTYLGVSVNILKGYIFFKFLLLGGIPIKFDFCDEHDNYRQSHHRKLRRILRQAIQRSKLRRHDGHPTKEGENCHWVQVKSDAKQHAFSNERSNLPFPWSVLFDACSLGNGGVSF